MAHFNSDEDHLVEREEHRNLDDDRKTTGDRIDLLALVELHQLFLERLLVFLVALLQHLHFRLHGLHLRHRLIAAAGEREEHQLHDHSDGENGEAKIADKMIDEVDKPEERLGDEIEPAPIDHQLEVLDRELVLIGIDELAFLGACEHAMGRLDAAAGTNCAGAFQQIGLIDASGRGAGGAEARVHRRSLIGDDRGRPIFIGNADPAALALHQARGLGFLFNRIVGVFLNAGIPDDAEQAFVQNNVTFGLWLSGARGQRIGIKRDRIG